MFVLVFSVIVASFVAFFATQNVMPVTLHFGTLTLQAVPLYAIVIGTLLFGLLIAYLINLLESVGSTLALRGRERSLTSANHTITSLQKEIEHLKLENAKLHGDTQVLTEEKKQAEQDAITEAVEKRPLFGNIRHAFR